MLAIWLAAVAYMAWNHAFWRDEVRALSFALSGSNLTEMFAVVRGDGHPLIWYLLLRGAYALTGSVAVLPAIALIVGVGAALLLVYRSPFGLLPVALLLFGKMLFFEYAVMARNYGIGMLIIFLIATIYGRCRKQGYWIGILLFLLVNTNVPSVILAAAFLIFWLLDLIAEDGLRWTPALTRLMLNGALATVGVLLCAATVYPPIHDAALIPFRMRLGLFAHTAAMTGITIGSIGIVSRILLVGSVFGLIRQPAAFIAAGVAIYGLSLFFMVGYPGSYRQTALILAFVVALYWIWLEREGKETPETAVFLPAKVRDLLALPIMSKIASLGQISLIGLLAYQLQGSYIEFSATAQGDRPFSQSSAMGALIKSRPHLKDAVIIADPDFMLEPLPYTLDNPTYLMRQGRYGNYGPFTMKARLVMSLDEVLAEARKVAAERKAPVVIMLWHPLDTVTKPVSVQEGYNWKLNIDPAQVARFRAATTQIASLRHAQTDEEYDVYVLKPANVE